MSRDGKCVAMLFWSTFCLFENDNHVANCTILKSTSNLDQKIFHDIKGENIRFLIQYLNVPGNPSCHVVKTHLYPKPKTNLKMNLKTILNPNPNK